MATLRARNCSFYWWITTFLCVCMRSKCRKSTKRTTETDFGWGWENVRTNNIHTKEIKSSCEYWHNVHIAAVESANILWFNECREKMSHTRAHYVRYPRLPTLELRSFRIVFSTLLLSNQWHTMKGDACIRVYVSCERECWCASACWNINGTKLLMRFISSVHHSDNNILKCKCIFDSFFTRRIFISSFDWKPANEWRRLALTLYNTQCTVLLCTYATHVNVFIVQANSSDRSIWSRCVHESHNATNGLCDSVAVLH